MAAFLALAVCAQSAAHMAQADADSANSRARRAEEKLRDMERRCPCCGQLKPEYGYNGSMAVATASIGGQLVYKDDVSAYTSAKDWPEQK